MNTELNQETGPVEPTTEHIDSFLERYVHPSLWVTARLEMLNWQILNSTIVNIHQQRYTNAVLENLLSHTQRLDETDGSAQDLNSTHE